MTNEERIKIYLDGQAQSFVNATSQAKIAISSLLKIFGMGALAGGGIVLAQKGFQLLEKGIAATIDTLKECIVEAGKDQETISKLNAVLKATGVYTDDYSQALIENSKVLQNKTTYTDEDIRSVEAQLAVYKLTKQEIIEATEVTADMAATMGVDLSSAATIVGKAMEGLTTPLRRYGIILDENKLKIEGSSYVLEVLRGRFQGVAEAQANTAEGLKTRFGNQIGELKETIGAAFLPVIENLMSTFLEGTPKVDKFGNAIGDAVTPLERLQGFIKGAAEKIKEFLETLTKADWTPVVTGLDSVAASIGILVSGHSSFETLDQKVQNFVDTLGELLFKISQIILVIKILADVIIITIRGIESAVFQVIQLAKGLTGLGLAYSLSGGQIDAWSGTQNRANEFLKLFQESMDNADADIRKITEDYKPAIKAQNTFTDSINKSTIFLNNAASAARSLTNSINSIPGSKTITIQTIYESITRGIQNPLSAGRQSGGIISNYQFASDLNIPLYKGEAVLPTALVRAIKENRGSFAGIKAGGNSPIINVNVTGNYISDSADEDRLADKIGNKIMKNFKLQGNYVG